MAGYDLIIRGSTVVTPEGEKALEMAVTNGRIAALEPTVSGTTDAEIDATGLTLFPGMIDAHVHFNEPGRVEWEGFATGSDAAAAGGVTTVFDMPLNSWPCTLTAERYREKEALAAAKSRVKVSLWGGLTPDNLEHLEALYECGVIGFKAFMSASGIGDFPRADRVTLEKGMAQVAQFPGMRVAVHAEDDALTSKLGAEMQAAGRDDARAYLDSRPIEAELIAIREALEVAEMTGCPLHIVHVSSADGLALVSEAKARGLDVTAETCPHYLALTEDAVLTQGPIAKCAPPLRPQAAVDALWAAVLAGAVDTIGSDHSPCLPEMKEGKSVMAAWGGIAGVQLSLPLLLSGFRERGGDFVQLAQFLATRPAEIFGQGAKTGSLVVGKAADFCLVEPREWTITPDKLRDRHRQNPYLGSVASYKVISTWVDGRCVFAEP